MVLGSEADLGYRARMTQRSHPLPESQHAQTQAGLALMATAMLIGPGLDVVAKLLMERLTPGQVTATRFLVQSVFLLPLVWWMGQLVRPERFHALAGGLLAGAILCFNMALREMPVANALAIFFVEPLVLTILAALVLGERLGWRRLTAVAIGLVGALVVLRPNLAAYGWAAAWPLGTACLFACYMLVTRVMSRRGGRLALQFWTGVTAMCILATATGLAAGVVPDAAPLLWPTGRELALFAGLGLLAVVVHQLIVLALARAEAGLIAPFQYLEIVSAVALGWLVFGDFPDAPTWLGTAIIVASGVYVFRRERVRASEPVASPPAEQWAIREVGPPPLGADTGPEPVVPPGVEEAPIEASYALLETVPGVQAAPYLLIVRVTGEYPPGSHGRPHARKIGALIGAGLDAWGGDGVILDLTGLAYVWGDDMMGVLDYAAHHHPSGVGTRVVASALCRPALETLVMGEIDPDPTLLNDTVEEAARALLECMPARPPA